MATLQKLVDAIRQPLDGAEEPFLERGDVLSRGVLLRDLEPMRCELARQELDLAGAEGRHLFSALARGRSRSRCIVGGFLRRSDSGLVRM